MKQVLLSLTKQLIFWLLFFAFARLIFLLFHFRLLEAEDISLLETIEPFWYALKLDLATACYILFIPFLILLVQSVYSPAWLNIANKVYSAVIIVLYSIVTTAELGVFAEWRIKLPYKAFHYLDHPSEIFNSTTTGNFFLLLALFALQVLLAFYFYYRFLYVPITRIKRNLIFSAGFLIFTPVLLFLGMRGGVQQIPINQSESYYSKHTIMNLAAVNSGFNFYVSVFENLSNFTKNPFVVYSDAETRAIVTKIYSTQSDTTIQIIKTNRPNIVLIILEGWSADLLESLGGKNGITPQFSRLEKGGILFTAAIASGARSEQGMASIFGGFPATPFSSITIQPDKSAKLPSLVKELSGLGYTSSFYYGGQLIYGNIKGYLIGTGFRKIREIYDFDDAVPRGKSGVRDEFVYDRQLSELRNEKQPFFSTLYTLSSHAPYDVPMEEVLHWGKNERKYINAVYYSDKCLGEYIEKAKKETWYANTLFIVTTDHSHNSYNNWDYNSPQYHHIPMLFFGDVLKAEFRGSKSSKMTSNTDIPATLLAQLGHSHSNFHWSRDIMNPYSPQFNYYTTDNGLGWVRPSGIWSYDFATSTTSINTFPVSKQPMAMKEGKAYIQRLFQEYMDY